MHDTQSDDRRPDTATGGQATDHPPTGSRRGAADPAPASAEHARAQVEALYAAYRSGDFDAFRRLCSPDLEWIQSPGFPYGGHHVGPDAVVEGVFRTLPRHWEGFGFELDELISTPSRVVALGRYVGTHRRTGRSFRAETAHVFDLADGLVRRFRQYTDSALVRDAASSDGDTPSD